MELPSSRSPRRELLGVGVAFAVTAAIINWIVQGDLVTAVLVGVGGGVAYSLSWRVVQRSRERRQHDA